MYGRQICACHTVTAVILFLLSVFFEIYVLYAIRVIMGKTGVQTVSAVVIQKPYKKQSQSDYYENNSVFDTVEYDFAISFNICHLYPVL